MSLERAIDPPESAERENVAVGKVDKGKERAIYDEGAYAHFTLRIRSELTKYGPEEALGEGASTSVQQKVCFEDPATHSPPWSSAPIIVGMQDDVKMGIDDEDECSSRMGLEDQRCVTVNIFCSWF